MTRTAATIAAVIAALLLPAAAAACTSAIVAKGAAVDGNAMIWKHRDTSHADNYVDSVKAANSDNRFDYIALFNASDSLKREAWAGVNRAGFAIINTVAGNLKKNAPDCQDREGYVMSLALSKCLTVDDFAALLDTLPRPLGVRTNFGVLDSQGNGAYFETDDWKYVRYDLGDAPDGFLIRSNYSCSSNLKGGYGYDRYDNARHIMTDAVADTGISPELFTDLLSREYYSAKSNSFLDSNSSRLFKDQGFIPRPTSAASIVIELTEQGPVMWTVLGYPPASYTIPVTLDSIPQELRRDPVTGRSKVCDEALERKRRMTDKGHIIMPDASTISDSVCVKSQQNYEAFRKNHR